MKQSPQNNLYLRKSQQLTTLKSIKNVTNKKQILLEPNKSKVRCTTSRSLSQSFMSKSSIDNGIKLPSAHYNDRKLLYMNKSRALSQKSITYQSREISFSSRRRLTENKLQKVLQNRSKSQNGFPTENQRAMSLPNRNKIKEHMQSMNNKKYSKLINGGREIKLETKLLTKTTIQNRKKSNQQIKWVSPFSDTNTFKSRFQGKDIVAKKFQGFQANLNAGELKVLNLDRLFRNRNGKLGNVVPLPVPKLQSANSRKNLLKTIKKKDTIHEVIQQFNNLLQMEKLTKNKQKIGIRGKNFLRTPTLEQLMGIKIHKFTTKPQKSSIPEPSNISEQTFIAHHSFYKAHIKKDIHLTRRLISGIKQQQNTLTLESIIRFYKIFINCVAIFDQKIKFLLYFYIPHGQEKIQLEILKLILEIMCDELPNIENLSANNQDAGFLTKKQKSRLFFEALNRVLFADLKQFININWQLKGDNLNDSPNKSLGKIQGEDNIMIDREILRVILERNEDAVDLLIKLLMKE